MDYAEIVNNLLELPHVIEGHELDAVDLRREISEFKVSLEEREVNIISQRDAKTWGSNADERKLNQALIITSDSTIVKLRKFLDNAQFNLGRKEVEISKYKNLFYATRTLAELHAAHLLTDRSAISINNSARVLEEVGL